MEANAGKLIFARISLHFHVQPSEFENGLFDNSGQFEYSEFFSLDQPRHSELNFSICDHALAWVTDYLKAVHSC